MITLTMMAVYMYYDYRYSEGIIKSNLTKTDA